MSIFLSKEAGEVRELWQSRVLAGTSGMQRAILVRMFVKAYKDAIKILLAVTFPGFRDLGLPQIVGHAKIAPSGRVIADVLEKSRRIRTHILYDSQDAMRTDFAMLADRLKLDDFDRMELFTMLQGWVVADLRVGADGRRLAS